MRTNIEKTDEEKAKEASEIIYGAPDNDFYKVFLKRLPTGNKANSLGGKRMQVIFWVMQHLSAKNELKYSYREIAKKTKISYQTVARAMKAMIDADILRWEGKILIANPDIIFKGSHVRRMNAKKAYIGIDTPEKNLRIWKLQNRIKELDYELHSMKQELREELSGNSLSDDINRLDSLRSFIDSLSDDAKSLEKEIRKKEKLAKQKQENARSDKDTMLED